MKLSHADVVSRLEGYGLKFTTVSVATEGAYSPADAIWNYKDGMAHIPEIHSLVESVPAFNHKNSLASVFLQRIFGMRFPMIVYDYEVQPFTQTTLTSLFFFVLVIHNACEEVRPGRTRVTTTYNIGAMPLLRWLCPLVGWVLKRNYRALSAADIPLRERRGELRSWGYGFIASDYLNTENIGLKNYIATSAVAVPPPALVPLEPGLEEGKTLLWGRSDHFGLRLERRDALVRVYPRMCPHQGAALDKAACRAQNLSCPWHGRQIEPLAAFALAKDTDISTPHHRLSYRAGRLSIIAVADSSADS